MSSIISLDLLSYAANPAYLTNLIINNVSTPAPQLLAYDTAFASVIGPNATVRQVHNHSWPAFHEAGVYNKAVDKLYVTSNWVGNLSNPINVTIIDISDSSYPFISTRPDKLASPNGATSYYPPGSSNNTSTPSQILVCDQGDFDAPAALVALDPVTNTTTRILTSYLGRNFSAVNDARQHPVTGDIWFTDADYGWTQGFRPAPTIPKQVYRFSPVTGEIAVVADGFSQSNGIEFSPDLKTLYICDTGAVQFDKNFTRPATIYSFDVTPNARGLKNRRTFAYIDVGAPDGIHTDTRGNVWATTGDGVSVWDPEGTLLGKIWTGIESNNMAFLTDGRILVFGNYYLWVVENSVAVGREIGKDFGS